MHRLEAPLIVIDLDDVLCQTNVAVVKWHNEVFGTRIALDDFHYYHWWQNPGWGDPAQSIAKAEMFYASLDFLQATPVPGAMEAVQALKTMGFRLVIVTARRSNLRKQTIAWIDKWLPDIFENIHFSDEFVTSTTNGNETMERHLSKGEICQQLSASLLIDDSVENVLGLVALEDQTPALLFGDYEWNKRPSTIDTAEDMMGFDQRRRYELALGRNPDWWKQETVQLPDNVWRVQNWPEMPFVAYKTAPDALL